MQNGLGVVLAGGLGGFLYLQKQDKLKLEDQLSSELSSERSTVDELKQKVSPACMPCDVSCVPLQQHVYCALLLKSVSQSSKYD